ncbi:hypothetical protein [Thalassomonas haliotis]|uniref:Uncharacterized protein n=1 Tax=Thalassomonas haliotis TaxID=485448 RepID=A0ABY7V742_9GAMM|nr:hypothetical protein [Thalassomonas haliotis]WDE09498.1 hypothetical protein H3N35_14240 [Thalassomonas haliotis]
MGPISSSFSPLTSTNRLQNNGNSNTDGNNAANNNNVSVRPDEDNVNNGDRSQNNANLEVNSNNRTVSADISREQAVDRLEQNSQRQRTQSSVQAGRDEDEQNQLNVSPRQAAASADDTKSTAAGFAGLQQQTQLAENATGQFNENQQEIQNSARVSQSSETEQSTNNNNALAAPNDTFVEQSGQASQAQRRNAFISSEFVSQLDNRQGSLFDQTV